MKTDKDILQSHTVTLSRQDIIFFEHLLKDEIAKFLKFKSYSLYFPQVPPEAMLAPIPSGMRSADVEPLQAVHLPSERKILLPLSVNRVFLGVFQVRGTTLRAPKTMLPVLTRMAGLCLEKLLLYKISISDPLTGLMTRDHFLETVEREIEVVNSCLRPSTMYDEAMPEYRAGLSVVLVRIDSYARTQREFGFEMGDRVLRTVAQALAEMAPEQSLAARFNENTLALYVPGAAAKAVRELAHEMAEEFSAQGVTHKLTDEHVRASVSIGISQFPRDMQGALFERSIPEQARALVQKASKAVDAAREFGPDNVFAYSQILTDGGCVLDRLHVNRFMVNLGRDVGATDGQRYLVWAQDAVDAHGEPVYKGELGLMEVQDDVALAEVMHLADPAWGIEPGDRLSLLKESQWMADNKKLPAAANAPVHKDLLTGLLLYRDFLTVLTRARDKFDQFALVLVRVSPREDSRNQGSSKLHSHVEQLVAETSAMAREHFGPDTVGGRYSLNCLIYFHPNTTADQAVEMHSKLSDALREQENIETGMGLACHPYLNYSKADAFENCRKALDYALLLPSPHVGLFDSLAINISADRQFSQGDLYGAMEEYKLALLADENNNLARNSFGISLARLGKLDQAKHLFEEVIEKDKKDIMAIYNLGYACQKLGEIKAARKAYRRCLKLDPGNMFSLIRLGQIAEKEGRLAQAKKYYNQAALTGEDQGVTHRHLAKLALRQNKPEDAREHLHQALLCDPKDAISLWLLAKLYLDNGEDPEIAEAFARQSVALRPQNKALWLELSRAFQANEKPEEAKDAMAKAAVL